MECNKDEAVRARGIAEQKMQNGDFEGAKKFALKAKKLFSELDNISQLLTICDVVYCAKQKLYGSEMDWYGILQIEQSADESSITKQYRKLALMLHPDKNKFAGAEAAFKLIGEPKMILSNKLKRSQYDKKCKISVKTAPKPTCHPPEKASPVNNQNEFTNNSQKGSSKSTASGPNRQGQVLTFWTLCNACGFKYQYHKDFVKKVVCCPSCKSAFIVRDMGFIWKDLFNQRKTTNQGPCKVSSGCNGGKPSGVQFSSSFTGPAHIPKAGNCVPLGGSKEHVRACVSTRKPDEGPNVKERKQGVEMPKPNAEKPKKSGASRNAEKRERNGRGIEVEDCGNNSGVNSKVNGGLLGDLQG